MVVFLAVTSMENMGLMLPWNHSSNNFSLMRYLNFILSIALLTLGSVFLQADPSEKEHAWPNAPHGWHLQELGPRTETVDTANRIHDPVDLAARINDGAFSALIIEQQGAILLEGRDRYN